MVVLVLAAVLAATGSASAATVKREENCNGDAQCYPNLIFLAAAGEENRLTAERRGDRYVLRDSGARIALDELSSCAPEGPNQVSCAVPSSLTVVLNDGDDTYSGLGGRISGDSGNDRVTSGGEVDGGAGDDVLIGTAGLDYLTGGSGRDELRAGAGDDRVIDGSPEADTDLIDAGPGRDEAWYTSDADYEVDLTRAAPQGIAGEGDTLLAAEDVVVSRGRAVITGTDGPNEVLLFSRGHSLDARGGDDQITTDDEGGSRIRAGSGNDVVVLNADRQSNSTPDDLACGPGIDRIELMETNLLTPIASDCERVEFGGGPTYRLRHRLPSYRAAVLRVRASGCARCRTPLTIRRARRGKPVGRPLARARARGRRWVAIRLNGYGRRLLRNRRSVVTYVEARRSFPYEFLFRLRAPR